MLWSRASLVNSVWFCTSRMDTQSPGTGQGHWNSAVVSTLLLSVTLFTGSSQWRWHLSKERKLSKSLRRLRSLNSLLQNVSKLFGSGCCQLDRSNVAESNWAGLMLNHHKFSFGVFLKRLLRRPRLRLLEGADGLPNASSTTKGVRQTTVNRSEVCF